MNYDLCHLAWHAGYNTPHRPTVELRQVNDGFALYEAERLVRGGFDRAHTARLWAADQGLEVRP